MNYGLDTDDIVCFYEQEFYVLSNFSSFTLQWKGIRFDTSEAAYHWEKFPNHPDLQESIRTAISAHEAFKIAQENKDLIRLDWNFVKVQIMRDILFEKVQQHEYVKKKLLETGERKLIENSWRDDFWGWGPNKDGQNQLGKLWMDIRSDIRNENLSPSMIKWLYNSPFNHTFSIEVLKRYMSSKPGRQMIAASMVVPFSQRIYTITNDEKRTKESKINVLKNLIDEVDSFLKILSEDEQDLNQSNKIKDVSKQAYEFVKLYGYQEDLASGSS